MAIACGNTFILKPSEKDPSAAMAVAELLQEAGLPKGVMNVVHGGREAVETLLDAKAVKAISFVGSTPWQRRSTPVARRQASAFRPWAALKTTR